MGTKRQEALLQAGLEYQLDYKPSEWIIMQAICHRWNDHQIRPLRIAFSDLLDCTPYKFKKRGGLTVKKALRRLAQADVLHIEDNNKRYEKDLMLEISVVWQKFHDCLEDMGKSKRKEATNGYHPVESVQMKRAQNGSAIEMHSSANEMHSQNGSANEMHSSANETRSHSRPKEVKDFKKKEEEKAPSAHGSIPSNGSASQDGHVKVRSRPRPDVPTPQRFFNGVEPTELDSFTYTHLNYLRRSPHRKEAEWADWMMWTLRYGQAADAEAIPLTFN